MSLDRHPHDLALAEMAPDERLLWAERPRPTAMLGQYACMSLFGIPFTLFSLFWMAMASGIFSRGPGPGMYFALFGLPFFLVGMSLVLSPLWGYLRAKKTVYALSDRRALIIQGGAMRSVRTYAPDDITDLERRERADGSGNVIFARTMNWNSRGGPSSTPVGFYGVSNAREVERLIVEHLKKPVAD